MCSSVVVIIHNVIQVNLKFFYALISFLSEGNRVAFIYEGFIEPFYVPLVQGCFTLVVACFIPSLLHVFSTSCVGIASSCQVVDSVPQPVRMLSLSWSNLLGKMILSNVWRNLGSFVVIDVSCSNRGEAITGDLMIDSSSSF